MGLLRFFFSRYTFLKLVGFYVSLILICGSLFAWVEYYSWTDGLWWAVTTALTVGYGDVYPRTAAGRWLTVVVTHSVTLFILPLVFALICRNVIHDRNEFTHEEQEEIKRLLRKLAKEDDGK